jgi:hypothetical protein
MNGMNFSWSLSAGGTISNDANKATVLWITPGSHTLSVTASNACGVSATRQTTVDVILFAPVITMQDSILTATEGLSYKWYRYGTPIPDEEGGTSQSIVAKSSGLYYVNVESFYGCTVETRSVMFYATVVTTLCPGAIKVLDCNLDANTYQWQMNDSSGFVNITDNTYFAGTNRQYLQLRPTVPSSWYGYKFRCVTNPGGMSDTYQLQFHNTWMGAASNAWENRANWSCGKVPDANTDVVMNIGTILISSNVVIRGLTIETGVNLAVGAGFTLTVTH